MDTISDLYNTGDPSVSIKGFEREMTGPITAPVEPNLIEPSDVNKTALEKELLSLPEAEQTQILSLQQQAADAVQKAQDAGQIGVIRTT
jgi:hypothetical protein